MRHAVRLLFLFCVYADWCALLTGGCQQLRVVQGKRLITQHSGPSCPPPFMLQPMAFKAPANQRRAGSSSQRRLRWQLIWREANVLLLVFLELFGRLVPPAPLPALLIHQQRNIDIANEFPEILTGPEPETRPRLLSQSCFKKKKELAFIIYLRGHFLLFK